MLKLKKMELDIQTNANTQEQMPLGNFLNPEQIVAEFGVTEGMRVADFGSGSGHFAILLAQRVGKDGKVAAIDVQESALEAVRARAQAAGLENIEPIHADLEVLGSTGLPDDSHDLVLISNTLFQSSKKTEILKEAKRILKTQAVLVIIEWKKGGGGFGPPDNLRTDEETIQALVTGEGFIFEREINAGQFHFGTVFRKE